MMSKNLTAVLAFLLAWNAVAVNATASHSQDLELDRRSGGADIVGGLVKGVEGLFSTGAELLGKGKGGKPEILPPNIPPKGAPPAPVKGAPPAAVLSSTPCSTATPTPTSAAAVGQVPPKAPTTTTPCSTATSATATSTVATAAAAAGSSTTPCTTQIAATTTAVFVTAVPQRTEAPVAAVGKSGLYKRAREIMYRRF
ncbi:hypothetical protein HK102_002785 [Quaeritorhiza haematococci]|nr:hypothetical protein HK102_002785 [Quaeritorhiza haematococci]